VEGRLKSLSEILTGKPVSFMNTGKELIEPFR
jgi:hypothetical protein